MRVGLVCDNRRWADPTDVFRHVAAGLERIGCEVHVSAKRPWPLWSRLPQAAIIWNGVSGLWGEINRGLRAEGVRTLIAERGFFDRMRYTQIDPAGFNHTASWAGDWDGSAPPRGARRLFDVVGECQPVRPRREGYILILGQMPGDSQLQDSEIRGITPLVRAVEESTPRGVEIRLRPHPLDTRKYIGAHRAKPIFAALRRALDGARFAVTINSNAGNDAITAGCPLLCLGPATYATAGVAMKTTLRRIRGAIHLMLRGYHPGRANVRNYLRRLACRQWSNEELAAGGVLRELLTDSSPW